LTPGFCNRGLGFRVYVLGFGIYSISRIDPSGWTPRDAKIQGLHIKEGLGVTYQRRFRVYISKKIQGVHIKKGLELMA
jgi:hypothetical protein